MIFSDCRLPAGLMIMSRLEAGGPEDMSYSAVTPACSATRLDLVVEQLAQAAHGR